VRLAASSWALLSAISWKRRAFWIARADWVANVRSSSIVSAGILSGVVAGHDETPNQSVFTDHRHSENGPGRQTESSSHAADCRRSPYGDIRYLDRFPA
jgi:hypothetical protein